MSDRPFHNVKMMYEQSRFKLVLVIMTKLKMNISQISFSQIIFLYIQTFLSAPNLDKVHSLILGHKL